jgi:hypothetical protein
MAVGTALQAAIKLLADAAADVVDGASGIAGYENLLPDVLTLLPQVNQLNAEIKALQPADYETLITTLATDMNLPAGKTASVISASVKLLTDLATDIQAVVAATKT